MFDALPLMERLSGSWLVRCKDCKGDDDGELVRAVGMEPNAVQESTVVGPLFIHRTLRAIK